MGAKRKYWTHKELAYLRELYCWWTIAELSALFERKPAGIADKAQKLGLSVPPEELRRRRTAGIRAMLADPARAIPRQQKLSRAHTPERRERAAKVMREVIHPNHRARGHRLRPQARANIINACVRDRALKIGVPQGHPLRAEYTRLIRTKRLPAAEARRIIAEEIARLPKHERQIIKLQLGQARIVGTT